MLDYQDLLEGPSVSEAAGPLPEAPTADGGPAPLAVRRLRGDRMATRAALFDECAAALQFPPYFGHNLDAFDECLRDLDCPEAPGAPVVLAVTGPESVLAEATADREWLLDAVADANQVREEQGAGRLVLLFVTGRGDSLPHDDGHWWSASSDA